MQLPAALKRLVDGVLTTDRVLRIRLAQAGLAMLLMLGCVGVMQYLCAVGLAPAGPVGWWTLAALGGMAAFFGLIRAGWSRRLADPSMTMPQMLYAVACAAAGYGLAGPARGGVLAVLMLALMFGMFELDARRVAGVTVWALALFGGVMAWNAWRDPLAYPPEVEFGHFLMMAATLPAVSLLASRLSGLRERLVQRKRELSAAFARQHALATRDELTDLPNRRQMQALLEHEHERSERHGHPFCVALIDLDRFKRINDEHGHAIGDEVLRRFAQAALPTLRNADVLARWGGEEFVLLLADTPLLQARSGLERLREHLQAMTIEAGGVSLAVTLSAGVAEHRRGEGVSQLLARADAALYAAKAGGRNRVGLA